MKVQANNTFISPNEARYKNARISLLTIVILSFLNIFSIAASGTYFLFSAYVSQILTGIGYVLYTESAQAIFLIVFGVLAALFTLPYVLCYIFSKKRVGWMIAALVFFSLDSVLLLIDFVPAVMSGDISMIMDLLFHVWALVSIIMGVKFGCCMKQEEAEAKEVVPSEPDDFFAPDLVRTVTVTRKKSFTGMAIPEICYVNGQEVCRLKNGETASFSAPGTAFELGVRFSNGMIAGALTVPAGEEAVAYEISIKMGAFSNSLVIRPFG